MVKHYLAVDLGASSGRTIVGSFDNGKLTLKEMNRFWNGPTEIGGTLYWDFVHLFRHIKEGISLAKKAYGDKLISMGIDTWGVDFGLLDMNGKMLRNPVHYRDERTVGMLDKVIECVPRAEVFAQTGIQFMEINTLYQLAELATRDAFQYRAASRMLFSPDLLNYWLTGTMAANRSIASTSQFYNPVTNDWAYDLLEKLGIRTDLFAELVDPGTVLGETDGLPVVNVGSHDTASAFAAVPVGAGEHCAFLSSGTWSLLGTELSAPVINDDSLAANFTNEVGVCNTIRFLKNMSGLWIIQELRRVWNEEDFDYSWAAMEHMAMEATPFEYFVDPSDSLFNTPGDMAERIREYCARTGQHRPEKHAEILRTAYEGLALLYASVYESLETLSGRSLETLRIVGGGCQNGLLNQLAANATGRKVITGPIEATAIGNLMVQMLAMGDIQSLQEGRAIVRNSFSDETNEYLPQDSATWKSALSNWREVCARSANEQ
ncbi:MAG: rhamnulokinase [Gammaproteobacteria bacterium]|nr:rhamnulokinase [Gammaproteobacteria bacterium]